MQLGEQRLVQALPHPAQCLFSIHRCPAIERRCEPAGLTSVAIGHAGGQALGEELPHRLLGRVAGLHVGDRDLPHLSRELVEEADVVAQFDRRRTRI